MDMTLITTLIGASALFVMNVASLWISTKTNGNIQKIELSLNSRLTALIEATAKASHAAGRAEEVEEEKHRQEANKGN